MISMLEGGCVDPYYINANDADGRSIAHLINLCLGDELVGAELGIFRGLTTCFLLQECPSIKTIYAIDPFKPYTDFIKPYYDGQPAMHVDLKASEYNKFLATHNIKFSGNSEKVIFLEKTSDEALNDVEDNSLDFVFLDSFLTIEQVRNDLLKWYPKVKNGGLFSGHDWDSSAVRTAVEEFKRIHKIEQKISTSDRTFVWFK